MYSHNLNLPVFNYFLGSLNFEGSHGHHQGDRYEETELVLHCLKDIAVTADVRLKIGLIVVENQVKLTLRRGELLQKGEDLGLQGSRAAVGFRRKLGITIVILEVVGLVLHYKYFYNIINGYKLIIK